MRELVYIYTLYINLLTHIELVFLVFTSYIILVFLFLVIYLEGRRGSLIKEILQQRNNPCYKDFTIGWKCLYFIMCLTKNLELTKWLFFWVLRREGRNESYLMYFIISEIKNQQGRKGPLDTLKRMIKRREREGEREKER